MRAVTLSLNLLLAAVVVAVLVNNGEGFGKFDMTEEKLIQMLLRNSLKTGHRRLTTYSYKNCGDPKKELATVNKLIFGPDPITLPGELDVEFDIAIGTTIHSPMQGSIELSIKSGSSWIKVPCIGMIGSCSYPDICELLDMIPACPDPFVQNKIPCKCPLAVGHYVLPKTSFDVDVAVFPSGDYHGIVNLTFAQQSVSCAELFFTFA